jgi:hypothetical protein
VLDKVKDLDLTNNNSKLDKLPWVNLLWFWITRRTYRYKLS